jgi:succinate dehydrogenase / fumarate reductase cytochrome b subunit
MTAQTTIKRARPLSPHLGIYKPQLTSVLSITHRATGVALAFGLPAFVCWLLAIANGPQAYEALMIQAHSIVGRVLLIGWSWSFFFHFCNGIRHLLWDTGRGLDLKSTYLTGYIALAVSVLLTLAAWLIA